MFSNFKNDLVNEFRNYNLNSFKKDLLAGITVTAVALPLALAFGVSCGTTAAAGLITAVVAGIVIGGLSGGSFQISGPTGAMSAILIAVIQKYGLQGMWIAAVMAGIMLVIAGVFKLGKIVSYIPTPVVTGFTTGIALIIAIGQLDNFFGVTVKGSQSAAIKVVNFLSNPINPNIYAVLIGVGVIALMIIWPKKWNNTVPSSLIAIIVALVINIIFKLPVEVIGNIPQKLVLDERLTFSSLDIKVILDLMIPAFSITALAMIESLLCGEVGKKMKGEKFDANRELIAQGIGNIIIPFFGGVPATAAIARTSVAIKSGAVTRLVSMFHAIFLLMSMFLLAPIMSSIPLSALAGVLIVTAWRMNEWESIRYMFSKKLKSPIAKFTITMMATVAFDLTQAIIIGVIFSSILFIVKISNVDIAVSDIDEEKIHNSVNEKMDLSTVKVVYLTGPVFFATVEKLKSQLLAIEDVKTIILSMRGVPLIDTSGIQALDELKEELQNKGCELKLCGIQSKVSELLSRTGIDEKIGKEQVYWSAVEAIKSLA